MALGWPLARLRVLRGVGLLPRRHVALPPVENRCEVRVGFERRARRPGFGWGAAPRAVDQADRHAEVEVQLAAEVVGNRREASRGLAVAALPGGVDVVRRARRRDVGQAEQADGGIVRRFSRGLAVRRAVQRPLHVGLARAQPDFADQHVLDEVLLSGADPQRIGTARGTRRQPNHPTAVVVGAGLDPLVAELDQDQLVRLGLPPNRHRRVALQHHLVAKDRRRLGGQPGRQDRRRGCGSDGERGVGHGPARTAGPRRMPGSSPGRFRDRRAGPARTLPRPRGGRPSAWRFRGRRRRRCCSRSPGRSTPRPAPPGTRSSAEPCCTRVRSSGSASRPPVSPPVFPSPAHRESASLRSAPVVGFLNTETLG